MMINLPQGKEYYIKHSRDEHPTESDFSIHAHSHYEIHDYINVKRLIIAQELLKQGKKPTDIYEKCGFHDYSTFFRAYKSRFGISPGEEKLN